IDRHFTQLKDRTARNQTINRLPETIPLAKNCNKEEIFHFHKNRYIFQYISKDIKYLYTTINRGRNLNKFQKIFLVDNNCIEPFDQFLVFFQKFLSIWGKFGTSPAFTTFSGYYKRTLPTGIQVGN